MEERCFTLLVLEMNHTAVDMHHSSPSTYVQNGSVVVGFHELFLITKEATVPQHHCREDDGHVANALINKAKPRAKSTMSIVSRVRLGNEPDIVEDILDRSLSDELFRFGSNG